MKGYVSKKGERYYAVVYEGLDPLTGRERRRWHPAGTCETEARELAAQLAEARASDRPQRSSPTVAVYLTQRWLPSKQPTLRISTWDGYRRNIDLHVVPSIGRVPLRHLRPDHLERLYAHLRTSGRSDGSGGLDDKSVLEIHTILRRALDDALRRGLVTTNAAAIAHAPKRRPLGSAVSRAWNAVQLRAFLDSIVDSRFHAVLWLAANTGMRRGELLGLRWGDVDLASGRLSVNRALVSVGYDATRDTRQDPHRSSLHRPRRAHRRVFSKSGAIAARVRTRVSIPQTTTRTSSLAPTAPPLTPRCCPTCSTSSLRDRGCRAFDCMTFATPTPRCC